jgi:electron transfer flavoprotein beta subunit
VICGQQTTDGDTAQVGPELAEFLDLPHAANVCGLPAISATGLRAEMNLPEQIQLVDIPFPCLISVEKGIFSPRLPSYRIKQATRQYAIRTLTLDDLPDTDPDRYGLNGSPTRVMRIFPPEARMESETWTGSAEELAGRLHGLFLRKKVIDY